MGFAVQLFFDEHSTQIINDMWKHIDSTCLKINSLAHISLSVHDEIDPSLCELLLKEFASMNCKIVIEMPSLASFLTDEGVIFLAPVMTEQLLSLHKQFHDILKKHNIICHEYYIPGSWVPHCVLDIGLTHEKLIQKYSICKEFKKMKGVILESIGLIEYSPIKEFFRYTLQ